jgi:hypothetical protein
MPQTHFDKILLTGLVLVFAALAFRGYHIGNGDLSMFAADSCKLFSGALLTLITGRALMGSRNGDSKNGNGGSNETKSDSKSVDPAVGNGK